MVDSIFTKIIRQEIPCYKLGETQTCFAFLDIRPLKRGHALVIPKRQVDYLFDLEDELLADLISFSKKLAKAIEQVVPCKRVGVLVIGTEVPHAHIHLIPFENETDLNIKNKPVELTPDEFNALASDIRNQLDAIT